jgi:hypothetical protein
MVLRNSIKVFSENLIEHHLSLIIDEHQDPTNLAVLQDSILKELVKNRDIIYNQFIQSSKQKKSSKNFKKDKKDKKASSKRPVPKKTQTTLLKISNLYKKAVEERTTLKHKYTDLQHKYMDLSDKTKQLQETCIQQMKILKEILANQKKETTTVTKPNDTPSLPSSDSPIVQPIDPPSLPSSVSPPASSIVSNQQYDELVSSMNETYISSNKPTPNDDYDELFNVQYE